MEEERLTESFTAKLSKSQIDAIKKKSDQLNITLGEVVRRAIDEYSDVERGTKLILHLEEEEWEYLQTIAKANATDVDTAVKSIMEAYFILVNQPLAKSIKPLGELREIFRASQSSPGTTSPEEADRTVREA